jgi:hypothetical protein
MSDIDNFFKKHGRVGGDLEPISPLQGSEEDSIFGRRENGGIISSQTKIAEELSADTHVPGKLEARSNDVLKSLKGVEFMSMNNQADALSKLYEKADELVNSSNPEDQEAGRKLKEKLPEENQKYQQRRKEYLKNIVASHKYTPDSLKDAIREHELQVQTLDPTEVDIEGIRQEIKDLQAALTLLQNGGDDIVPLNDTDRIYAEFQEKDLEEIESEIEQDKLVAGEYKKKNYSIYAIGQLEDSIERKIRIRDRLIKEGKLGQKQVAGDSGDNINQNLAINNSNNMNDPLIGQLLSREQAEEGDQEQLRSSGMTNMVEIVRDLDRKIDEETDLIEKQKLKGLRDQTQADIDRINNAGKNRALDIQGPNGDNIRALEDRNRTLNEELAKPEAEQNPDKIHRLKGEIVQIKSAIDKRRTVPNVNSQKKPEVKVMGNRDDIVVEEAIDNNGKPRFIIEGEAVKQSEVQEIDRLNSEGVPLNPRQQAIQEARINRRYDKVGQERDPIRERDRRLKNENLTKEQAMYEVAARYDEEERKNTDEVLKIAARYEEEERLNASRIKKLTADKGQLDANLLAFIKSQNENRTLEHVVQAKSDREKHEREIQSLEAELLQKEESKNPLTGLGLATGLDKDYREKAARIKGLKRAINEINEGRGGERGWKEAIEELERVERTKVEIDQKVEEVKKELEPAKIKLDEERINLMLQRPAIRAEYDAINQEYRSNIAALQQALADGQINQQQFEAQANLARNNAIEQVNQFRDSLLTRQPDSNDYAEAIIAEEEKYIEDSGDTAKNRKINKERKEDIGNRLKALGIEGLTDTQNALTAEGRRALEDVVRAFDAGNLSETQLIELYKQAKAEDRDFVEFLRERNIPTNRLEAHRQNNNNPQIGLPNANAAEYHYNRGLLQDQLDKGRISPEEYKKQLAALNARAQGQGGGNGGDGGAGNPLRGLQGQIGGNPNGTPNQPNNLNQRNQPVTSRRDYAKFVARNSVEERKFGRKPGFTDNYQGGTADVATVAERQGINGINSLGDYLNDLEAQRGILTADQLKNRTKSRMELLGAKVVEVGVPVGIGLAIREGSKFLLHTAGVENLLGPVGAGFFGFMTGAAVKAWEVRDLSTENADEFFQRQIKPENKGIWGGFLQVLNFAQSIAVRQTFRPYKRLEEINGFLDVAGGGSANFDSLKSTFQKDPSGYAKFVENMFTQAALTGFSETGNPVEQAAMREKLMLAVAVMEDAGKVDELNIIYNNANNYAAGQVEKVKTRVVLGAGIDRAVKGALMAGAAQFVVDRFQDIINPVSTGGISLTDAEARLAAAEAARAGAPAQILTQQTITVPTAGGGGPVSADTIIRGVLNGPNSPTDAFGGDVNVYLNNAPERLVRIAASQDVANLIAANNPNLDAINAIAAQHGMTLDQALMGVIVRDHYDARSANDIIQALAAGDNSTWASVRQGLNVLAPDLNNVNGELVNNAWARGMQQVFDAARTGGGGGGGFTTQLVDVMAANPALAGLDANLTAARDLVNGIRGSQLGNAAVNIAQALLVGGLGAATILGDIPGQVNYGTPLNVNPDAKLNNIQPQPAAAQQPVVNPQDLNQGGAGKAAQPKANGKEGDELNKTVVPKNKAEDKKNLTQQEIEDSKAETEGKKVEQEDKKVSEEAKNTTEDLLANDQNGIVDDNVLLPTGDDEQGGELFDPLQGLTVGTDAEPNYVRLNLGGRGTPQATYRVDKINELRDKDGKINLQDSKIEVTAYDNDGNVMDTPSSTISYEEYRRAAGLDKVEKESSSGSATATPTTAKDDDSGDDDASGGTTTLTAAQIESLIGSQLTDPDGRGAIKVSEIDPLTGDVIIEYEDKERGFNISEKLSPEEFTKLVNSQKKDESANATTTELTVSDLNEGSELASQTGEVFTITQIMDDGRVVLEDSNGDTQISNIDELNKLGVTLNNKEIAGLNLEEENAEEREKIITFDVLSDLDETATLSSNINDSKVEYDILEINEETGEVLLGVLGTPTEIVDGRAVEHNGRYYVGGSPQTFRLNREQFEKMGLKITGKKKTGGDGGNPDKPKNENVNVLKPIPALLQNRPQGEDQGDQEIYDQKLRDGINEDAEKIENEYSVERLESQLNTLILDLGKRIDFERGADKGVTLVGTPNTLRGGVYQSVKYKALNNGQKAKINAIAEEEGGNPIPPRVPYSVRSRIGNQMTYENLGVLLTTEVLPQLDAGQKEEFAQWLNQNSENITIRDINQKIDGYNVNLPQYQSYISDIDPTAQELLLTDNNRKLGIEDVARNPELDEQQKKELIAHELYVMRQEKGQVIRDFDSIEDVEARKQAYRDWDFAQAAKIVESYKPKDSNQ